MKRMFVAATIALFAVGGTLQAQNVFEAKVSELEKSGEKIERANFDMTGVADGDNAAIELRKAGDSINEKTPAWLAYGYIDSVAAPCTDTEAATFADLEKENGKAFAALDLAMQRKSIDWGVKMTSPSVEILLPHLNRLRAMANLLQTRAVLRNHQGKDGAALKDVHRLLFISRATDQQAFVVGHLVAVGITAVASTTTESLAPVLKIGADQANAGPAATPEQVKTLVAELLDDEPMRKGMITALLLERMADVDMVRCIVSGRLTPERLMQATGTKNIGVVDPKEADTVGVAMLNYLTDARKTFEATSDYPTFKAKHAPLPPELGPTAKGMGKFLSPSVDRLALTHYRGVTDRKLAAIALAMRSYAAAHDGKLPGKLEELVPEYLPSVPGDPMAAGAALKYLPEKKIVYSVGDDGQDDGGSTKPAGAAKGRARWQLKDAILNLAGSK